MNDESKTKKLLIDYTSTPFLIDEVNLLVKIFKNETCVEAILKITPRDSTKKEALILDGVDLKLLDVRLNDQVLSEDDYIISKTHLSIKSPPSNTFYLKTKVVIHPEANSSLEGLYRSSEIYCTQCEAEGFRKITYFYDRPDVMSIYRVRIEAPLDLKDLLSNGNLLETGFLEDKRHYAVWSDPHPKPCYLFALVAGSFNILKDIFITKEKRKVELAIYIEKEDPQKCAYAMASLKRSMKWDEDIFNLSCDIDRYNIVAARDFNMGAMENKGLNIFNSSLLLADIQTTKDSIFFQIESIVAHEYFHNWTGNRVTCRDWFQLCLKEGLTVFRDQLFSQTFNSKDVVRILEVMDLKNRQFPEDAGPMTHAPRPDAFIQISNFYTSTVYLKGAEVCRMLVEILSLEGFKKGLALYFERHDGSAVTQEDFIAAMADATGVDLKQFFFWYTENGTPHVTIKRIYDDNTKTLTIHFKQSRPFGRSHKPFHIPVRMAVISSKDQSLQEQIFHLKKHEDSFTFHGIKKDQCLPSFFRGFSAPVIFDVDFTDEERFFLAKHESDPVSKWMISQEIYAKSIHAIIADANYLSDASKSSLDLFSHFLTEKTADSAMQALLLTLPSYKIIEKDCLLIDPIAIAAARTELERLFAKQNSAAIYEIAYKLFQNKSLRSSISHEARSARLLKNTLFYYLSLLDDQRVLSLLEEEFEAKMNMSDVLSSFSLLLSYKEPEKVIKAFYEYYKDNPIIMDNFFDIQAGSRHLKGAPAIEQLLNHPQFDFKNPNRVRSVLMAFCFRNPEHFHDVSGAGYRLCKNAILKLDAINPSMSSQLCRAFLDWRRFKPVYGKLMEDELRDLYAVKSDISSDLFEIVDKCLQSV